MKRELMFWRNDSGFHLKLGKENLALTHLESRELLKQMIQELPGLPGGVKAAWEIAQQPVVRPFEVFAANGTEIVSAGFYGIVEIGGATLTRTPVVDTVEAAVNRAAEWLELPKKQLHVEPITTDAGSYKAAETAVDEALLDEYLRENNLTMAQLATKIARGEL